MMTELFKRLQSIHMRTAILEALEWDDSALDRFMDELELMLIAAPPNVEKALFWIRETPWDVFNGTKMPHEIYGILDQEIRNQQRIFTQMTELSRMTRLPPDEEWN